MFNIKLNQLKFTLDDVRNAYNIDESLGTKFSKNDHFKILGNFIVKYCEDNNYNDKSKISALIKNIRKLFDMFTFNEIISNVDEDDFTFNPLKYYTVYISKKQFKFKLIFNSFSSDVIINVTFIYGINDEVIVSVERNIIYDNQVDDEDIISLLSIDKRSLSPRGAYYSLLSPEYQSHASIKYGVQLLLMKSILDNVPNNDFEKIDKMKLMEMLSEMFILYKYHLIDDENKSAYLNEDGSINKDLLEFKESMIIRAQDNFDFQSLLFINNTFNEIIDDITNFVTTEDTMIDIKDLESVICETVIDTILLESFDAKHHMDNIKGYTKEINEKVNKLSLNYFNYYIDLLNHLFDLNTLNNNIKSNPVFSFKKFFNKEMNEVIDENLDINNRIDPTLYNESLENERKEMEKLYEKISIEQDVKKEEIEGYEEFVKNSKILKDVNKLMIDKYGQNFIMFINNFSIFNIFNREKVNRYSLANIDRIFGISSMYNISSTSLNEDKMYKEYEDINSSLRKKYNIEPTIKNLRYMYSEYVNPLIDNINNINDNINMLNETFSKMNISNIRGNYNEEI